MDDAIRIGDAYHVNKRCRRMMILGVPSIIVFGMVFVLLIMLIKTASQHRRHSSMTDPRICRSCGASHPPFAQFCRKCGSKL
jgi:ribosomal protein L40E